MALQLPRKILVRGVNWLGDAVMTTPALQRLRQAYSRDTITLLTDRKLEDLWKDHPAIDGTISFSREESAFAIARRLRERRFDIALILPNSFRSALECWLARIPIRIGHAGNLRGSLLTERVAHRAEEVRMHKRSPREVRRLIKQAPIPSRAIPRTAHQVYNYWHLTNALVDTISDPTTPHIRVHEDELLVFRKKFGLTQNSLLGLNAGAEYGSAKRWPVENFIATAIDVFRKMNCCWIVFGGAKDRDLASRIAGEINSACGTAAAINTAGQTTLRELCAGLALCSVVLTNDSGPMHVAAAVGSRVVVPFGSTAPELTAPGLQGDNRHIILRSAVPCAPCFQRECPIDLRCLTRIEVRVAVAAVLKNQSIMAT